MIIRPQNKILKIKRCEELTGFFLFVAFLNHKVQSVALTAEDVGSEGAAGDPEVVGVILFVELLHVQVPQSQVSVGGSAHKHLTAWAEGAGHHRCVLHRSGPL